MGAMGAGHFTALADAGIERSQACFGGHSGYVAGKQQDYTKYRCSHRLSAWVGPCQQTRTEQRRFQMWNTRMALIPHRTVRNEFAKKHLPADGQNFFGFP